MIRGLVGRMRAAIELWSEVENGLRFIDKSQSGVGPVGEGEKKNDVRAGYLFGQAERLSDQVAAVNAVSTALVHYQLSHKQFT